MAFHKTGKATVIGEPMTVDTMRKQANAEQPASEHALHKLPDGSVKCSRCGVVAQPHECPWAKPCQG